MKFELEHDIDEFEDEVAYEADECDRCGGELGPGWEYTTVHYAEYYGGRIWRETRYLCADCISKERF